MIRFLKRLLSKHPSPVPADRGEPAAGGHTRTESEVRRSEEHFAHLVAGVRDYAVFLLDRDGRVLTWNVGAERAKGYRADEIVGRHFSTFYPPDAVASGWPAHELEVASVTGRFEDEGWRVRKDGSRFWASVVITALRDEGGRTHGFLKITRDMTDRKQAEEKLRRSEERFRLMVESVQDYAIFMLDPAGHIATWNAGAERLKGYAAHEIVGQHFSTFYPQDALDRGWPAEELRRAAADGRIEDEGWRVRKDGSRFWANVVITALRDEDGTLRGYAKVTRDLSERKAAEEGARRLAAEEAARQAAEAAAAEVERQREQLHVTLASIGDAVIVTDTAGAVTFLNPVATELTGWTLEEAAGRPVTEVFRIVHEHTRQTVECPVGRVLREGVVVGLANHTVLLARDGREVPVSDSGAPIRGRGGELAGVVLVFRDETEARHALDTRLRLAAIVEASDDAIIGETPDGVVVSWNHGAERLYGYTAAEMVGRTVAPLCPSEHAGEQPELLARVRGGEHVRHFETVRVRKDATRLDVSLTMSPIRDADGRVVGVAKVARDITERKAEDRRKSEFLALLAHELRNPLAPLRNGLKVLQLAGDDRAAFEHTRDAMDRQLTHVVRLVDDLLDVSRISQGKLLLRKEVLPLAAAVGHAVELCDTLVQQTGHQITVSLPDEPVYVDADKTRLAQTVCNLLTNAVKYSDPGSPVRLTARREGDEAVVSVADEGAGIPPDMLGKVFDMFTQVDRTLEKSQGGLGVGLGIVKRLVELHGGTVEARSEGPGKGSEFVVRLPLAPPPGEAQSAPVAREPAAPAAHLRVLVADDNADAAESLAMLLRLMGHEVATVGDGVAAVEAGAEFRPNVMLLDIGMPRLNGYDACRRVREQPWGKGVTAFALTGWGQEEDRRRSRQAGFDGHLVKPVDFAELEKALAGVAARAKAG